MCGRIAGMKIAAYLFVWMAFGSAVLATQLLYQAKSKGAVAEGFAWYVVGLFSPAALLGLIGAALFFIAKRRGR